MRNYFYLLVFSFFLVSCQADMATDNLSMEETSINLYNDAENYLTKYKNRGEDISDVFIIDTAYIVGDWLTLRVSYSGGCAQHSFDVYWSNSWIYTEPPQTYLLITHNANYDFCEAWITQDLSINLAWLMNDANLDEMILVVQNGSNEQDFILD